jgi:hypothetical protein
MTRATPTRPLPVRSKLDQKPPKLAGPTQPLPSPLDSISTTATPLSSLTDLSASTQTSSMNAQGQQPAPQPDFDRVRTSLNDFVDEMQSVVNLPAIQNANHILDALNAINGRLGGMEVRLGAIETCLDGMDARLDGIDTRLDGIETRLDRLDLRTAAENHNHSAIIQNSRLFSGTQPLTALHHSTTNALIPGFPATGDELKGLSGNNIYSGADRIRTDYSSAPFGRHSSSSWAAGCRCQGGQGRSSQGLYRRYLSLRLSSLQRA